LFPIEEVMSRSHSPQTLRRPVIVEGHGLHSNQPSRVVIHPVHRPEGIRFKHLPSGTVIPVSAAFVGDLSLATTLTRDGVKLGTVEHLLSALAGLGIEHALVEVDAEELPILDGSAGPWVQAILEAGVRDLPGARRFIKILRPVEVQVQGKWMRVSPHPGLRLRYTIDFSHPAIGRQVRELTLTPEKYQREVALARTFCMERDIEFMRSKGLALGGSLDNAVVFGAEGPLNDGLRFDDEAVRHKMLDLVGDLALLGAPLMGFVEANAAGHAMHVALVKAILDQPNAWTWAELSETPTRREAFPRIHAAARALPA
jgi:UDP-3-O-[3-hydroxymyristoyl] N-acetylglucosamine deacetylase